MGVLTSQNYHHHLSCDVMLGLGLALAWPTVGLETLGFFFPGLSKLREEKLLNYHPARESHAETVAKQKECGCGKEYV